MQCLEHLAFKHSINIYLINIHLPNEQINTYLMSLYHQKCLWPLMKKQKTHCHKRVFSGIGRELENHRRKQNAPYSLNLRIFSRLENVGIHVREIIILMNFMISQKYVYLVRRQLCSLISQPKNRKAEVSFRRHI